MVRVTCVCVYSICRGAINYYYAQSDFKAVFKFRIPKLLKITTDKNQTSLHVKIIP